MSEPSSKLDMTSLNEALEASGEAENPTEVKAPDEQARETMNKSNTLTADAARQSPETLSPASPSGSPMPDTLAKRDGSAVVPGQNDTNQPAVEQQPLDPTVQQIKSMFPDLDLDTIQAVVSAEGGDFERAINTLLQMSDPNYVPPPPAKNSSQTERDEQLARSLAAAEGGGGQSQRGFVPPSSRGGALGSLFNIGGGQDQAQTPSYDPNNLTYQPRVRRTPSNQATTAQAKSAFPSDTSHGANAEQGGAPWPGPKEAKQWQEDINKFAETGLAKAASTFSAIRQRSEQAWAARSQPSPGVGGSEGGNGGATAGKVGGSFFGGWNQRTGNSAQSSTVSPTIGSNRGFDRDPSPVGDNELAKILARGRNSGSGDDDGYRIGSGPNVGAARKPSLGSIADRYKKVAAKQRSGPSQEQKYSGGNDDDNLGWDDAGRTDRQAEAGKSFEPIKISDRSSASDTIATADKASTQRNAVSLMEGSTGRGLTSPTTAGAGGKSGAHVDKEADDDDDDDDLEYVANPFEDED